jgi:hypothetical protein
MQRNPNGDLRLGRRQFLRAGAGLLALPALEATGGAAAVAGPRNFVAIGTYLGWHPQSFFPAATSPSRRRSGRSPTCGSSSPSSPGSTTALPTATRPGATSSAARCPEAGRSTK